ncbi:MAG: hypothetical protein ACO39V_01325 [Arenicellales bacterium]
MAVPTRSEVEAIIAERITADPAFRDTLMAHPLAVLSEVVGIDIPDSVLTAVSASAPEITDTLLESLAEHGRLVAVVGEDPTMQTIIMRRRADGGFHKQSLFETHVAPMIGLERKRVFSF